MTFCVISRDNWSPDVFDRCLARSSVLWEAPELTATCSVSQRNTHSEFWIATLKSNCWHGLNKVRLGPNWIKKQEWAFPARVPTCCFHGPGEPFEAERGAEFQTWSLSQLYVVWVVMGLGTKYTLDFKDLKKNAKYLIHNFNNIDWSWNFSSHGCQSRSVGETVSNINHSWYTKQKCIILWGPLRVIEIKNNQTNKNFYIMQIAILCIYKVFATYKNPEKVNWADTIISFT